MSDLSVTLQCRLKVGSSSGLKENYVSFAITSTGGAKDLNALITIPCGETTKSGETFLWRDGTEASLSHQSVQVQGQVTETNTDKVRWKSGRRFSLPAGEPVTVRFTGFNPDSSGKASLHLKIWNAAGSLHDEEHTVLIDPAEGVAIIKFDVRPTVVPENGEVKISVRTTGAKTVCLYGNNVQVPELTSKQEKDVLSKEYVDSPKVDTKYRLDAWRAEPEEPRPAISNEFAWRELKVDVKFREKWNPRDLLKSSLDKSRTGKHYYPSLLLAGNDLSPDTPDKKLYGVFVCKETKQAELWSSSSGIDGWSWKADIPEGMGESPGVIYKDRLWLIGGSSADPKGPRSNRLWCYYKGTEGMETKEWGESEDAVGKGELFTPRMGHACVVFDERMWVLGGLSVQNVALQDVWSCSFPDSGDSRPVWQEHKKPAWSGRCMSAAVTTPDSKPPRIWLYGGAAHPYDFKGIIDELWWSADGKNWELIDSPPERQGAPLGVTLLVDSQSFLQILGEFGTSGGSDSYSKHMLKDLNLKPPSWNTTPLGVSFDVWRFPQTDLYLIRSVCFGEWWILWPVYQYISEIDPKTRYDAMIYAVP